MNEYVANQEVNNQSQEKDETSTIGIDILESKIQKLIADKRADRNLTITLRSFFGGALLFGILGLAHWIDINVIISYLLACGGGLVFLASFSDTKQVRFDAEIRMLQIQKERLEKKSSQNTNHYFDNLVTINLRNLEEYYELVKNSNKKSFLASLTLSILGVLLILGGLTVTYVSSSFKDISYLASASGIIVEIISGLMFFLYSKTVLQLKEYHDSLLDVQNILLSFKLIEDTRDEGVKSEIMKQMIEFLVRRKNS